MANGDDAWELDGVWEMVYGEEGGRALPETASRRARLLVTEGAFTLSVGGDVLRGAYRPSTEGKPGLVDAVVAEGPSRGAIVRGLFETDGCRLKVCLAAPGGDRPRDLDSGDFFFCWEAVTTMVRSPVPRYSTTRGIATPNPFPAPPTNGRPVPRPLRPT